MTFSLVTTSLSGRSTLFYPQSVTISVQDREMCMYTSSLTDGYEVHKTQVPCTSTAGIASGTFSGPDNSKRLVYYPSHTLSAPWSLTGSIMNVPLRV